jgi:hypothetical protein
MKPKLSERIDRWIYIYSPLFMPISGGIAAIIIAIVLILNGGKFK